MADTGAVLPQSAATASEDPWLDNDWTSPANIYGAGEASVTAASYDAGDQTFVLKAYNFDFSAIPSGSTIDGVVCVITARYATAAVSIDLVQLLNTSLAKVGNNLAGPTALTTSSAPYTFGSSTNKWGNALDDVWVKNSNFGVAVGMLAGGSGNSNNDVYVDSVTLQVYYTVGAQQYTKTLTTTEAISDTRARVSTFSKLLTLTEAISDSLIKSAGMVKLLETTEAISDSLSAIKSTFVEKLIETSEAISDSISKSIGFIKTLTSTVNVVNYPNPTDDFNRVAVGSNWTIIAGQAGTPSISGNQFITNGTCKLYWNNGTYNNDQFSEAKQYGSGWRGITVRESGTTDSNCVAYVCWLSGVGASNNIRLGWHDGTSGFGAYLDAGNTFINTNIGDILRLEVSGQGESIELRAYLNGVLKKTLKKSEFSNQSAIINSGNPGLYFSAAAGIFDDFTSGNLEYPTSEAGFNKSISENVGLTDILSKVAEFSISIANSIGITDAISRASNIFRDISENLGITDSISKIINFSKLITNTLGITDFQNIPRGVIVNIDHETGDLSQYTSNVNDGGDLSVTAGAALAGTSYGLSCLIDDATAIYGQKTVSTNSSGIVRLRFYLDPNSLTMAVGDVFNPLRLYTSSSVIIAFMNFSNYSDGYGVSASAFDDAGSSVGTSGSPIHLTDAPHYIEINVTKSSGPGANDGRIDIWVDGGSLQSATGIDNDTRFADFSFIRIGAVGGIDAGTSGTFYLDELVVNDDGGLIGPKSALWEKLIQTTEAISDSIFNSVIKVVELLDSVGITDAISKVVNYSKAVAESVGVTDTANKVINYIRTLSVTEAISDSMSAFSGLVKLIVDSVGVTDAVSKIYNSVRTIAITESISDSISKSVSYIRTLTTQEGITDLVNKSVAYIKSIANSVGITDFIDAVTQSFNNYETTISDSEGISDSLSRQAIFLLTKTDTESVSDVVAKSILFAKLVSDSLGTTDALTKVGEFVITILTVENISDSISRTVQFIREIIDAVSISDVITAIKNYVKPFVPHIHLGGTTSGHSDHVGKAEKNVRLAGHVDKNND